MLVRYVTCQRMRTELQPWYTLDLSLCDLGWLVEKWAYQKSLQFTNDLQEHSTHMDGNDGEEKERKKHL